MLLLFTRCHGQLRVCETQEGPSFHAAPMKANARRNWVALFSLDCSKCYHLRDPLLLHRQDNQQVQLKAVTSKKIRKKMKILSGRNTISIDPASNSSRALRVLSSFSKRSTTGQNTHLILARDIRLGKLHVSFRREINEWAKYTRTRENLIPCQLICTGTTNH